MDRRLQPKKRQVRRRLYGRTKPGTLLKHHIPIRTDHWDLTTPGFTEVDLVSRSGNWADGEGLQSLNLTDILTGWVESSALWGKSQRTVRAALEELRAALPFPLRGLDSDNGSEFINTLLLQYCRGREIAFTRGRPYKKDDNAHAEQKNWTHVRKLLGWDRYDSREAQAAINDLYRHELRLMMNLFQPSVKLRRKTRAGPGSPGAMIPRRRPSTGWWPRGRATPSTSMRSDAYGPDSTPSRWRPPSTESSTASTNSPTAGTGHAPAPIRPRRPSTHDSTPNRATGTTTGYSIRSELVVRPPGSGKKINDMAIPLSVRFVNELTGTGCRFGRFVL